MSIQAITGSIYQHRIGALEFREVSTAPLSCFAAFLRWMGVTVNLDMLMDIVPIPTEGASSDQIVSIARRVGIEMRPITFEKIKEQLKSSPVLIQRKSGYAILLFELNEVSFIAALPGHPNGFCSIPFDTDLFDEEKVPHSLHFATPGPALRRVYRDTKLYLLAWHDTYRAEYNFDAVIQLNRNLAKINLEQVNPIPLRELTVSALLASHRSISCSHSKHLGTFRKLNLRRSVIFVDFRALPKVTTELMLLAKQLECSSNEEVLMLASRLFVDFLIIHPFVNANRRMAMLIVSKFMDRWDMGVRWNEISRSQIYFWMRCASNGHFKPLENGLREQIFVSHY